MSAFEPIPLNVKTVLDFQSDQIAQLFKSALSQAKIITSLQADRTEQQESIDVLLKSTLKLNTDIVALEREIHKLETKGASF